MKSCYTILMQMPLQIFGPGLAEVAKATGNRPNPLGPGFENQAQCPRSGGEEGGAHLTHGHAGQTGADPEEQVGAGIG